MIRPFHLALPVRHLEREASFFETVLGCTRGRSAARWIDLNLYGHQLVLHEVDAASASGHQNPVDGESVPVPHFGVVLSWSQFHELAEMISDKVEFEIAPTIRFAGKTGEQATMFFRSPDGHALEFKAFRDDEQLFAS